MGGGVGQGGRTDFSKIPTFKLRSIKLIAKNTSGRGAYSRLREEHGRSIQAT